MKKATRQKQKKTDNPTQPYIRFFSSLNLFRKSRLSRWNSASDGISKTSWRNLTCYPYGPPGETSQKPRKGMLINVEDLNSSKEYELNKDDIHQLEKLRNPHQKLVRAFQWELNFTEDVYEEYYQEDKQEAGKALESGDLGAFYFFLLFYGPRLLAEPAVLSVIQKWWWAKAYDKEAREKLQDLCDALLWMGKDGRPKELTPEKESQSRSQSAAISKGKTRWVKKYERYEFTFGDAKQAAKQVLMEFDESSRIEDPLRKSFIRQELEKELLKKVSREG